MKKEYFRLLFSSILFLLIITLNCFFKFLNIYTIILFLLLFLIFIYWYIGYEKSKQRYQKDIIIQIISYSVVYYIITYMMGFYIGFYQTGYSLKLLSILNHIWPLLITIPLVELIRYIFVSKGFMYKSILFLIVINFVLVDINLLMGSGNILQFILTILIPSIGKNILLVYLTYKVGYKTPIVYRYLFELPIFLLPIFPAFGIYIQSLIGLLFPILLIYLFNNSFEKTKAEKIVSRQKTKIIKNAITFFVSIILLVIIALTTGVFKYFDVTIGSNSMLPKISKGDVVLVEKLDNDEKNNLKEGDILAFNHGNIIIVHRIIKIIEVNGEKIFYTKGDNNNAEDGYPIRISEIVGKALFNIPYIGYPTVEINELFQKK